MSDAEDVAATRLDMFGDPSLKEALVVRSLGPGDGAVPLSVAEASADPPQPEGAPDDGAQAADVAPAASVDEAPADAPGPVFLAPLSIERRPDAEIDPGESGQHPPGASDDPVPTVPPEPEPGTPSPAPSSEAQPAAVDAAPAPVDASTSPSAPDAVAETAQEQRNGEAIAAGPFGSPFMMPPGMPEQDGLGDTAGPMIEPPRFRDELMIVKDTASDAIAADAAVLPDMGLSPSPELPQEPPFTESDAQLPQDLPAAPTFSSFPEEAPFPEGGSLYLDAAPVLDEAPPIPSELAPPPASPLFDAAAKIAAEASATAEALENLRRLLDQKEPHLQPVETAYGPALSDERMVPPAPLADGLRLRLQGMQAEPPPFTIHEPALLMPLPVPPQRSSARGVYLFGFLTGLALSLMAGVVLYFFIIHAGAG